MIDPFTPAGRAALGDVARTAAAAARWGSAGIPVRFRTATLAAVAVQHGADVAEPITKWAVSRVPRPTALVLVGPPGTGKTFTALAVARAMCDQFDFAFGSVPSLLQRLRPDGDLTAEGLCRPGLLVLDDLGSERLTEWAAEQLDTVLDHRWLYGKPTVVTSNLSHEALREHVGPRAWSRLTAKGSLVLRLAGDDLRRETS